MICKKNSYAFTLIEVVVAAAVFSLFLTSLFSLYRMGTRMYAAGSWRLQKQKDAERFLNILRERIAQASNPVSIDNAGAITETPAQLSVVGVATYSFRAIAGTKLTEPALMMAFPLSKPAIKTQLGLIMYNLLRARPSPSTPGLMALDFISTPDIQSGVGQAFFSLRTGTVFFPSSDPVFNNFKATPETFNTPQVQMTLDEVSFVRFNAPTMPTGKVGSDTLITLVIEFEHPKYPETKVQHSMTANAEISITKWSTP